MVDATPDDRFNALGYSTIRDDISLFETEINLPVGGANAFNKGFQPGAQVFATLTDVLGSIEVIKITDIEGDKLTVERGQDVTIAQAWLSGSIITQRFVATNALQVDQKTVFRTIAFNPNGGMTADYPGEKVREIGLDACANRWWKNTFGTNWRLIAGIRCPGEIDDAEGYPQPFTARDIFLAGGFGFGGGYIQDCDGYEPDIDTWSNMSDVPVPARANLGAFSLNLDFGYVFGGVAAAVMQTLCDEYNLDVWAGKTSMPGPARRAQDGFNINDKGYAVGGDVSGNGIVWSDDTDEFDSTGDSWVSKTAMPEMKGFCFGGAEINSKGYCQGGSVGGGPLTGYRKTNYEYVVDSWAVKTDLLLERSGGAQAVMNSKSYLFAGSAYLPPNTSKTDLNHEYDPVGDSWAAKTVVIAPVRSSNAGNHYDNKGYIMAGLATQGGPDQIDDVDEYEPTGDSWTVKSDCPSPARSSPTSFSADGGL